MTNHYDSNPESSSPGGVFVQTSVFVAHSCPLMRRGICSLIEDDPSLVSVGEAGDMPKAIREIRSAHPHIAMVEFADKVDGVHVCNVVKTRGMGTRVLLLAMEASGEDVYNAVTAGAAGYLTGRARVKDIRRAIKDAVAGEVTISHDAQGPFQSYLQEQEAHARAKADIQPPTPLLSAAEQQILRHMARGMSIAETARVMYLSASTVKNHRQSLFAKLSVANAPAAIYTAIQRGLLR